MIQQILRRFLSLFLSAVLIVTLLPVISVPALAAVSGELSGLTDEDIGASYSGSDDGSYTSWSVIGGNGITGTAKSEDGGTCGSDTKYITTLTLTNNGDTAAILSFDYKITLNSGTIQVASSSVTEDGSYKGTLEPDGSIKIYLESGDANNDTKIEISGLSMIVETSVTTTFRPAENGSYTVDNEPIIEETAKTQQSTEDYVLKATAAGGYKFYGWYSVTQGKYLSMDAEASLLLDSDQTVTAVFVSEETPIFDAGGSRFTDLNEANEYASDNGIEKITLVSDGTLPAGNYTISKDVTLLIPFDDAGTCYRADGPGIVANSYKTPTEFRKLTMAPGAHITVDGAVSVSAQLNAAAGGSEPRSSTSGPYGRIVMMDGSSMTVNGSLYVYGYVTGNGEILATESAEVHEIFELREFRGGTITSNMVGKGVFPLSQYYIQNIEAPLTLKKGAKLETHAAITALSTEWAASVTLIGAENSEALFKLKNGSITKRYLPEEDRCQMDVNGDLEIASVTLKLGPASVTSSDYVLPINGQFRIKLHSGTTLISENTEFLPGVEVTIDHGARMEIVADKSLYIYDSNEWKNNFVYNNKGLAASAYSPTRTYTRSAADLTDVLVDVNGTLAVGGAIYTTAGGANVTSSQGSGEITFSTAPPTDGKLQQASSSGSSSTYYDIHITSAKLHNGVDDPEYTETAGAQPGDTYQFCEYCRKWYKVGGHTVVTFIVDGAEPVTACAENGTVTCPVAAEPIRVTVMGEDGTNYGAATHSWENGTLTIGNLYLSGGTTMPDEVTATVVTQAVAQIIDSAGAVSGKFATLADAVANFNDETQGYIQLLGDVTEDVTISDTVRLDLADFDVKGTVTISDGGTLYGMDSSSDGYEVPTGGITSVTTNGTGAVAVFCETPHEAGAAYQRYAAIRGDDGSYTFHRFNLSITGYRFEMSAQSDEGALIFLGTFRGDTEVVNKLDPQAVTAYLGESTNTLLLENTVIDEATGEYKFQFYKIDLLETIADTYDTPIKVFAVVTFRKDDGENDETICNSETHTWSWKEAWENGELDSESLKNLQAFLAAHNITDVTLPSASSET